MTQQKNQLVQSVGIEKEKLRESERIVSLFFLLVGISGLLVMNSGRTGRRKCSGGLMGRVQNVKLVKRENGKLRNKLKEVEILQDNNDELIKHIQELESIVDKV